MAGHVEGQPFGDVTKRGDLLEMDIDGVAAGDRKEVAPGRFVTNGACVDASVRSLTPRAKGGCGRSGPSSRAACGSKSFRPPRSDGHASSGRYPCKRGP